MTSSWDFLDLDHLAHPTILRFQSQSQVVQRHHWSRFSNLIVLEKFLSQLFLLLPWQPLSSSLASHQGMCWYLFLTVPALSLAAGRGRAWTPMKTLLSLSVARWNYPS